MSASPDSLRRTRLYFAPVIAGATLPRATMTRDAALSRRNRPRRGLLDRRLRLPPRLRRELGRSLGRPLFRAATAACADRPPAALRLLHVAVPDDAGAVLPVRERDGHGHRVRARAGV